MNNEIKQIINRYSQWFKYLELSRIDGAPIFIFDEKNLNKLKYCEHDLIVYFDGKPFAIKIYKDNYNQHIAEKIKRILKQ